MSPEDEAHETHFDTPERSHEYWRDPDDDIDDPEANLQYSETSRFLVELIESRVDDSDPILEIGCNSGRNLSYLEDAGYENLAGIELNGDAIELLAETHPELAERATIHHGVAEDVLPTLPDGAFELTMCVAILAHIHPEHEERVFDQIDRVTDGYLLTVENEETDSYKQVARDYERVFEGRGFSQIEYFGSGSVSDLTDQRSAYRARLFEST